MKITNKHSLPDPLYRAVLNDSYDAGDSDFTITTLIKPPQMVALARRYDESLETDAIDRIWSLIGQVAHGILERADVDSVVKERRLYMTLNGHRIGGQMDRMAIYATDNGVVLEDYKVTSVWAVLSDKPEWEQQLNCYVKLLRENGVPVAQAKVIAILRDWSARESARRGPDDRYPDKQVVVVDIPIWSDAEVTLYLTTRLALHVSCVDSPDDDLPHCTDEERWKDPEKWALKKTASAKRASFLYDTEAEAVRAATDEYPGYVIEHRPSEAKRCTSYCEVSALCHQYQTELKANGPRRYSSD